MQADGLGDDRIARGNRRGEIAAGDAVERERKIVRPEHGHRTDWRQNTERMLFFVSIVGSAHEPSTRRGGRLPQLVRRPGQLDVGQPRRHRKRRLEMCLLDQLDSFVLRCDRRND